MSITDYFVVPLNFAAEQVPYCFDPGLGSIPCRHFLRQ
jgi:hypothetical protein